MPDPVWVLGEWEMTQTGFPGSPSRAYSRLDTVVLLEMREPKYWHRRKCLEKGRDVRMQSFVPPLADYESFKAGQLLSHPGWDAGINKSAQMSTCLELHTN